MIAGLCHQHTAHGKAPRECLELSVWASNHDVDLCVCQRSVLGPHAGVRAQVDVCEAMHGVLHTLRFALCLLLLVVDIMR